MVETSFDIVSLGAYTPVLGAVFRAYLFSDDNVHYLSEGVLFDIVDNGRDAQAAACSGSDGVLSITTSLFVCRIQVCA